MISPKYLQYTVVNIKIKCMLHLQKRVAKMIDKSDLLAWAQFLEYIRTIGAQAALVNSGAKQGDTIVAGEISWTME